MTLNTAAPKSPTSIYIQGRAKVSSKAERAQLTVRISDSGLDKDSISSNVITTVNAVKNDLERLCSRLADGEISPASPITSYHIDSLSISVRDNDSTSEQPLDSTKRLHSAESIVEIHFRDFSVLGDTVVRLSSMKFVGVNHLEWQLTDGKSAWLAREVRMQALRNAVENAQAYACIIGKDKVSCVKIEDTDEFWPMGRAMFGGQRMMDTQESSVAAGIQFEPGSIEVSGTVKAEFHAE